MYTQDLFTVVEDHIKPKVLKRMNRYNKWEYGYNEEHNIVIISKTGSKVIVYHARCLHMRIHYRRAYKLKSLIL